MQAPDIRLEFSVDCALIHFAVRRFEAGPGVDTDSVAFLVAPDLRMARVTSVE